MDEFSCVVCMGVAYANSTNERRLVVIGLVSGIDDQDFRASFDLTKKYIKHGFEDLKKVFEYIPFQCYLDG